MRGVTGRKRKKKKEPPKPERNIVPAGPRNGVELTRYEVHRLMQAWRGFPVDPGDKHEIYRQMYDVMNSLERHLDERPKDLATYVINCTRDGFCLIQSFCSRVFVTVHSRQVLSDVDKLWLAPLHSIGNKIGIVLRRVNAAEYRYYETKEREAIEPAELERIKAELAAPDEERETVAPMVEATTNPCETEGASRDAALQAVRQ